MPDNIGHDVDDIGLWSIRKNDIVEYYASVYADITKHAQAKFTRYYIDGFANRGHGRVRGTNDVVPGSALRLLNLAEPFDKYIFVEQDQARMADLRKNVGNRADVEFVEADANVVLPETTFPAIAYGRYDRALCFLDPYNMKGLRWGTITAAGKNRAIEVIVHFPTMDAHRTVLRADRGKISDSMKEKMRAYWGDDSWLDRAYTNDGMLPMQGLQPQKLGPKVIVDAFRDRLKDCAGFSIVSKAFPMRNSKGNIIYHLVFASHSEAARRVMRALEKRFIEET